MSVSAFTSGAWPSPDSPVDRRGLDGLPAVAPKSTGVGGPVMPGLRRTPPGEMYVWTCEGCDATTVCTTGQLHAIEGWRLHSGSKAGGGTWRLLICRSCEAASAPTKTHPTV